MSLTTYYYYSIMYLVTNGPLDLDVSGFRPALYLIYCIAKATHLIKCWNWAQLQSNYTAKFTSFA